MPLTFAVFAQRLEQQLAALRAAAPQKTEDAESDATALSASHAAELEAASAKYEALQETIRVKEEQLLEMKEMSSTTQVSVIERFRHTCFARLLWSAEVCL